jgi:predicted amidohydrolase YtcJ
VSHLYTLLVGGTVIPGGGQPDVSAIAWADDTVLLLGSDDEVRGISRGDSHLVDLEGRFVVPLGETLEIGGPADLAVVSADPRTAHSPPAPLTVVRGGKVVVGSLPGAGAGHHHS